MAGRFIRNRDLAFFDTVNKELLGDPKTGKDGVIDQIVHLYKVDAYETETNLYGRLGVLSRDDGEPHVT